MFPSIEILGRSIPTYWICAFIGLTVSAIGALVRHKSFTDLLQVDITNAAAFLVIGIVVGGRLLSILTLLPILIRNWDFFRNDWRLILELFSNGLVFYGGLFGAIFALYWYTRRYQLDQKAFFDYLVPFFPLFQAFGRIGCFLTGCCHGKVSERFGIAFTHSISAENGIPFFPIQLVSVFCNLLLFIILLRFEKKHHQEGLTLTCYLVLYAIGRFIIEFFRGDEIRGFFLGISTSQWISLIVLFYFLLRFLRSFHWINSKKP